MTNNIKKERLNLDLTQKDLADKFNQFIAKNDIDLKPISYAAISRWESGENEPKESVGQALSTFFHVDIAYLRGYSSERVTFGMDIKDSINGLTFNETDHEIDKKIKKVLIELITNAAYFNNEQVEDLETRVYHLEYPDSSYDEDPF